MNEALTTRQRIDAACEQVHDRIQAGGQLALGMLMLAVGLAQRNPVDLAWEQRKWLRDIAVAQADVCTNLLELEPALVWLRPLLLAVGCWLVGEVRAAERQLQLIDMMGHRDQAEAQPAVSDD